MYGATFLQTDVIEDVTPSAVPMVPSMHNPRPEHLGQVDGSAAIAERQLLSANQPLHRPTNPHHTRCTTSVLSMVGAKMPSVKVLKGIEVVHIPKYTVRCGIGSLGYLQYTVHHGILLRYTEVSSARAECGPSLQTSGTHSPTNKSNNRRMRKAQCTLHCAPVADGGKWIRLPRGPTSFWKADRESDGTGGGAGPVRG